MRALLPHACRSLLLLLASGCLLAPASAQSVPPAKPAEEMVIVLNAFEVRSSKDLGYRVANSVATTGIAQALLDTPLSITVFNNEFLRDAGKTGFLGALAFASAVALDENSPNGNFAPGAGRGNSQGNLTRFRGQPYNGTFRNGLRQFYGFDTENIDRVEVAKGPMAVFVGGATLGGEVNNVTKKPLFVTQRELTLKIASHETYRVGLDLTGPINQAKTVAYRLIMGYRDGNQWQENSHSTSTFINPIVLWNVTRKLSTRFEVAYRTSKGNAVSQPQPSTMNYQRAFENPSQSLLDLGRLRTGALAGVPFTVAEYRSRIGYGGFGQWRTDILNTTGKWTALGVGETLSEGMAATGRRYNYYGPNAGFSEPSTIIESETTLVATEWFDAALIGRYTKARLNYDLYSFGTRLQPAGYYQNNNFSANRTKDTIRDLKFQGVLKKAVWRSNNKLLFGGQFGDTERTVEDAVLNYAAYPLSVPVSPHTLPDTVNPARIPAVLTGANAWIYWDPRAHPFPDNRLITTWPSAVQPAGVKTADYNHNIGRSGFAALNSGWFDDRVMLTAGKRYNWNYAVNASVDRHGTALPGSSATPNIKTESYTLGATVRVIKGVNVFASQNQGETGRAGASLVSRVSFAPATVPIDIVTPAERAANPAPNDLGKGREIGLKYELFDRKLTGSFGWFNLTRGNILITDTMKNSADPRNRGTEADLNPATSNPAVRASVNWLTTIDGNTTEGYETDWLWTPNNNYSLWLAASHLYRNSPTINKLPTNDVSLDINYWLLKDRPLPNSPDTMVRCFQRYAFTEGVLKGASVGFSVRYQSSQQPAADNTAWGTVFPAYTVYDLTLGYSSRIRGLRVDWQLQIDNLRNQTYYTGNRVFGAPREFTLSAITKF
jgi:outer membrane receptor protein involved in Fe transport